jgi:hypothetical protein
MFKNSTMDATESFGRVAVGSLPDGTRWMAPTNWVGFSLDKEKMIAAWEEVSHVEFIVGKDDVQES